MIDWRHFPTAFLISLSGCGSQPDYRAEAVKVLDVVLAYEARKAVSEEPTCIEPEIKGVTFDEDRDGDIGTFEWNWKDWSWKVPRRAYFWFEPRWQEIYGKAPPELAATQADPINSAANRVLLQEQPEASATRIDVNLVDPPIKRKAEPDCTLLEVKSPVFSGSYAFVETGLRGGSRFNEGSLYALERQNGRWTLIGDCPTWIT